MNIKLMGLKPTSTGFVFWSYMAEANRGMYRYYATKGTTRSVS